MFAELWNLYWSLIRSTHIYVTRLASERLDKTPLLIQNVRALIHMSDRATAPRHVQAIKTAENQLIYKDNVWSLWICLDEISKYFQYLIAVDPLHLLPTWAGLWSSKLDGPGAFPLVGRSGGSCICYGCLGQPHCGLGLSPQHLVIPAKSPWIHSVLNENIEKNQWLHTEVIAWLCQYRGDNFTSLTHGTCRPHFN